MISPAALAALAAAVGQDNLITDPALCLTYGYDNSRRSGMPAAVLFPCDHEQVVAVVRACRVWRLPLIARGRGTGTTGAVVPEQEGVVILSTERLRTRLEIDAANRVAVVEPGFTNGELQTAAAKQGFFWPPDPTSAAFCSIGGNLAYNSAGPRAVKYGTPRENTLGLRVVTGTGETLRTGSYTTKGVVGYDFTRLLIGSEGTLGIITEATLKLTPLPEAVASMQAFYRDIHAAAQAISAIMAQSQTPSALELIDGKALDLIRGFNSGLPLPADAGAMLMIEADGSAAALEAACASIRRAASNPGLLHFEVATSEAQRKSLWAVRGALSPAQRKIAPKKINEDVVVPVSNLPALIAGLEALSRRYQIPIVNFGHAGNGNIHVNLLIDPDVAAQAQNAHACLDQVFDLVLELKGTLSGEHGIGIEKRDYVARELDPTALRLMAQVKRVFDPDNILNPGKSFPAGDRLS